MSTNRLNHNYLLLNIYSGIDSPVVFDSILTSITILPIAYNTMASGQHTNTCRVPGLPRVGHE